MKDRIQAIVTLIVAIITIFNVVLTAIGLNPLPISEEQVYMYVSGAASLIALLVSWWNNQNWTEAAVSGQTVTDAIKSGDATTVIEAAESIKEQAQLLTK